MKPNAQHQTAIEILDAYRPTHGPLAPRIKKELKTRRYAGSKDRRAIANIVFEVMRQAPLLMELLDIQSWKVMLGRPLMMAYLTLKEDTDIADIFTGEVNAPDILNEGEKQVCADLLAKSPSKAAGYWLPEWLYEKLKETCDEADFKALQGQAPFDIRCNEDVDGILSVLDEVSIEVKKTPYAPQALRILDKTNMQNHPLFEKGAIDIQDESSQILAHLCDPKPGMKILDLCAGAGGKALAMASLCPDAEITATDIELKRLKVAHGRAQQQGLSNIEFIEHAVFLRDTQHINAYDLVLVDAPCSGTGTLRRHPEMKVLLSPGKIDEYADLQKEILQDAQRFVADKGRLSYATCSFLTQENQDVAAAFLESFPFFSLVKVSEICDKVLSKIPEETGDFLELGPGKHETDGFFTAFFDKD